MTSISQNVSYTNRAGEVKAAIVTGTPATVNPPEVTETDLAVLAKHGYTPKAPKISPLAEDEALLVVFGVADNEGQARAFSRRAYLHEDGTFHSVFCRPVPETTDEPDTATAAAEAISYPEDTPSF